MSSRKSVRTQLVAAPLIVAQAGLHKLRELLDDGDSPAMTGVRLGDHYSMAETLKLLGQIPQLSVLKLLHETKAMELATIMAKVAAELDFVQTTLDLVATKDSLNPSMHAVAEAFKRRHLEGYFASGEHNVRVDSLIFADTKSKNDFDHCTTDITKSANKKNLTPRERLGNTCHDFQRGYCRWRNCRFEHRCSECGKRGHGQRSCWQRERSKQPRVEEQAKRPDRDSVSRGEVPPNPRRRTDRPNRN